MKHRIYFFANFGDWDKQPHGGGEVGNRKTLELFRRCGFEVITIPKYLTVRKRTFLNLLILGWRVICNLLTYFTVLLMGKRKSSCVHISGFYGPMVYFEFLLVLISKLLGYKTIYEMRGGGANYFYESGSSKYHYFFKKIMIFSDGIISQGKENFSLVEQIKKGKNIFYYPNYVMDGFYPLEYPKKKNDRINFIYFGRLSGSKHIDLIADVFVEIFKKYENCHLELIGDFKDDVHTNAEEYKQLILFKFKEGGVLDNIVLRPACDHTELKKYLPDKHFYIFPSTENREGHSNAMTEAMAFGIIPIASAQGFSRTVINNDRLIVEDISLSNFVDAIDYIISNNLINQYSMDMYNRVVDNYTDSIVCERLSQWYNKWFV